MKGKGEKARKDLAVHAHELLKRVVRAEKADRFALFEVCPRDATAFLPALQLLVDTCHVERVSEGCGKWFYRLTESGLAAARQEKPPKGPKSWERGRDEE